MATSIPREEAPSEVDATSARKAIFAGSIGHAIENYDFNMYGFLAVVIATLFFPPGNESAALLATFAGFAVGYVMRPVGALFFGPLGDRAGRRTVLIIAVLMMSAGTLMIGVLPTYAAVGILAPILLLVARLIQGFASGGEFSGSTTFIVEYAPDEKRGAWGSWQQFSTVVGVLIASGVAALLTSVLSEQTLNAWGWRIPFFLALVAGIFALYLRLRVAETPKFAEVEETDEIASSPLKETIRNNWRPIVTVIGFTLLWSVGYHSVFAYTVSLATAVVGLPLNLALIGNTIGLVLMLAIIPVAGAASDRIGRKPLLIVGAVGFVVFTYPGYLLIQQNSFVTFLIAQVGFSIILAIFSGPAPAALVELFPTNVRASAIAIGYSIALVAFGGTTPLIETYLVQVTGSPAGGAIWIIGAAIVTLIFVLRMRETARSPLPKT